MYVCVQWILDYLPHANVLGSEIAVHLLESFRLGVLYILKKVMPYYMHCPGMYML